MSDLQFSCPKCRGTVFKVPRKDLRDSDKITCEKCGFTDAYGRIVGPQAKKYVENEFKKAFKNIRF